MGAVNTTYTFTATDTITSTKMNNIIDQTTITDEAIIGNTLEVASGKLKVRAQGITSNEMATGSVTSNAILDGTIVNADINASAAIAGTKISPNFGPQNISNTEGNLSISNTGSCVAQTTSGTVTGQLYASSTSPSVAVGSVSNNPLVVFTNNTERMRITAAGNIGIGTGSPSEKFTVIGPSGGTSALFSDNVNSTLSIKHESPGNLLTYETSGTASQRWVLNGSEKARIDATGNVGIGKNPTTKLDVNGTVTATAFAGPLTGNVTGSSGSCTGNSATATTAASCSGNSATATLATKASTLSNGGSNGNAMTFHYSGQGGQPTWVWGSNDAGGGNNNYVWNPANFSVNYANGAGTAITVYNGAITAQKLNGAQSGDAPIFGVRAWVNFNGTSGSTAIRQAGNVSSVTRNALGRYTITFSTAMQDTNYAIVGFARDADNSGGNYFVSALSGDTKTTTQVQIEVNSTGGTVDSPEINLMIIR